MIPGLTPSAVAAIATLPPGYSEAVGNPFRAVLSEPGAQLVYLVKAMPRDPDARISVPGWPGPVAAGPVTGPAVYRGGGVAIYWGSQHYLTEPTDVPSSTLWRGVLQQPYSAEMRLFGGTDPFGAAESGFGSVVALNGDGDYDAVTGYNWAGAAIEILVGGAGRPLSDFAVVARPEGDGLGWDRERIELRLRDRLRILSRSVARRVYTGAGGVDGAAAIAGQPAPLCYGQVRHAPLKMIDPVALLLQAHDGPIHAVAAVYERGLAFPPAVADYPTPAALLSADVPA
ncbi:MAG TPA: hypothetical protein VLL76_09840, partial [Candidatus Omnitrophota bacterium]|nr:hypothetical protein [Candidatus Omnitrophota bacterium]